MVGGMVEFCWLEAIKISVLKYSSNLMAEETIHIVPVDWLQVSCVGAYDAKYPPAYGNVEGRFVW